ncbi:MAG: NAD(P)H-hydrate epimerase [bacterium]
MGQGIMGGDGLVAARHLLGAGVEVEVLLIGDEAELKADPKTNYQILKKLQPEIFTSDLSKIAEADLIIDAIFGIGLQSLVCGPQSLIIKSLNKSGKPILAVDVPSGLNADTGEVMGVAIKAGTTVTFVAEKQGFCKAEGPNYCGRVIVRKIF